MSVDELQDVTFDFDKYAVTTSAKDILQANADYLKENNDLEVLVEGHCDEWGTNEYNLGLGQKRAAAVREYYMRLGVEGGRIGTISFGEEKPIHPNCGSPESSECRANRRAETKVR